MAEPEPGVRAGAVEASHETAARKVGRLEINLETGWVTLDNERLELTAHEYQVLACLARQAGRIVPAIELLRDIWGCDGTRRKKLNAVIYRLRQKIEPDASNPIYLITARGRGYYLPTYVDDPIGSTLDPALP